jgi:hypothetical protein
MMNLKGFGSKQSRPNRDNILEFNAGLEYTAKCHSQVSWCSDKDSIPEPAVHVSSVQTETQAAHNIHNKSTLSLNTAQHNRISFACEEPTSIICTLRIREQRRLPENTSTL